MYRFIYFLLFATLLQLKTPLCAYDYELVVCAIFQNDADWLPEWIEFHERQGVEHFYLYNNFSQDHYKEILQPYVTSGLVEVIDWKKHSESIADFTLVQCGAYQDCIKKIGSKAKWCAIIDTDEFLFSTEGRPLPEILAEYDNFSGVAVNWLCFGTSNVQKIPQGEKMVETLLLRAPIDFEDNYFVKCIVKPTDVLTCDCPHYCKFKPKKYCVTENKKPLGYAMRSKTVSVEKLRINHYWARDLDFFYNVKIDRWIKWGKPYTNSIDKEAKMNAVYDDLILRVCR